MDADAFVDTGGSLLLVGAAGVGKSTVLWRLHRAHRPATASLRLAALLDAVSARSCREQLRAFCRGPVVGGSASGAHEYDRQIVIDDVDTLPRAVQHVLAALIDQFRPQQQQQPSNAANASGRCRFLFSCSALAKVHAALRTRLPCTHLAPPSAATLAALALREATRLGLPCGGSYDGGSAAAVIAAVRRRALFPPQQQQQQQEEEKDADSSSSSSIKEDSSAALDALIADCSRVSAMAAYRVLRQDLAPVDLLDAMYVRVRNSIVANETDAVAVARALQWLELIARAMRGLPPALHVDGAFVPWFSVIIATEKSLL
jgi:hypothetical protein